MLPQFQADDESPSNGNGGASKRGRKSDIDSLESDRANGSADSERGKGTNRARKSESKTSSSRK